MLPKSTGAEGTASERETAGSSFKQKRYASYASGDTDDSEFDDSEFDDSETESSAEPFSSPVSDIRWSGTSLAGRRSSDGVAGIADKGKGTKEQIADGLSDSFVAVLAFGGLFFLLLMISFFVFAW